MTTGIPCPQCQATESDVKHTDRAAGAIVRRRQCSVCGVRFSTTERLIGTLETPTTKSSRLLQVTIGHLEQSLETLTSLTLQPHANQQNQE